MYIFILNEEKAYILLFCLVRLSLDSLYNYLGLYTFT